MKLGREPTLVKVQVARVSAWSVGFMFEELTPEQNEMIHAFIDPLHVGSSLRLVDRAAASLTKLLEEVQSAND